MKAQIRSHKVTTNLCLAVAVFRTVVRGRELFPQGLGRVRSWSFSHWFLNHPLLCKLTLDRWPDVVRIQATSESAAIWVRTTTEPLQNHYLDWESCVCDPVWGVAREWPWAVPWQDHQWWPGNDFLSVCMDETISLSTLLALRPGSAKSWKSKCWHACGHPESLSPLSTQMVVLPLSWPLMWFCHWAGPWCGFATKQDPKWICDSSCSSTRREKCGQNSGCGIGWVPREHTS